MKRCTTVAAINGLQNWVLANRRMAAALTAKGYAYRYVFSEAADHTDGRVTREALPGALEWLWQGFPVKGGIVKIDFAVRHWQFCPLHGLRDRGDADVMT